MIVARSVVSIVAGLASALFAAFTVAPIGSLTDRLAWSWVPLAIEATTCGSLAAYWSLSGLGDEAERQRRSRRNERRRGEVR